MAEYEKAVFISYARGGESEEIVSLIDQALQQRGLNIIRDKRDLGNRGSISQFMERTGQGNCVIVVISDKYLRSANCMFELVEIAKGKQFHDRVFPIVLGDADIYNPVNRIKYIKHWEEKLKELDEAMRSVSSANLQGIRDEIDSYDEIRDNVSNLTFFLKDMNTFTPEMHHGSDFSQLYDAIEKRIESGDSQPRQQTKSKKAPAKKVRRSGAVQSTLGSEEITSENELVVDGSKTNDATATETEDMPETESVSQTDSSEPVIYKARIVVEPLNVRNGPGTSFPRLRTLKKDDLVDVFEEQRDESQNDWGRIGPDQWIWISNNSAIREQDQPQVQLREPEQPKVKFEYRHRGVLLAVAYTEKGWRMNGLDSLFVASAKTLNGPEGSFFKALLDDIPSTAERSKLLNHLQDVITSMPESENTMAISITPELAPVLLPHCPPGKATIITGITSSPQLFDEEEKGEAYVQDIIRKSVVFAGVNGLVHLLMPVVGSQTVAHMERTIQTLTGIREFGSLKNITIVSIAPELVKAARDRFKVLTAEQNNLRQNNRAQAVENDQAQGSDQLGIKNEVDALADTLLLRDVEPPIAVGVMGGWGSGKSFVMYLIKKRIEEIRAKSVKKGWPDNSTEKQTDIPPYVGHIYQVDFNAWTYAKSNLWASLMDTIFLNLNRQMQIERLLAYREFPPNQTPPTAEDIRTSMLTGGADFKKIYVDGYQPTNDTSLSKETIDILNNWSQKLLSKNLLWQVMRSQNEQTIHELRKNEEELAHLKARQEALEKSQEAETPDPIKLGDGTLARSAYHQLLKTTLLKYVSDTFGSSIRKELKKQNLSEDELLKLQNESKDLLKGFKGLSLAFRQNKYYVYAAFGFAVLTLALPYLFEIFGRPILDYGITKVIAAVSAAVPIVQAFLTRAQKVMEFEQETKEAFESAYENQRESQAEKIVSDGNKTFDEKVQLLEKMSSDGSLPALNALITLRENQIEEQRQQIGPAGKYASLLEFVQSRLDAATYENQLGLMHHVRKDIDELTYSLADKADPKMFPRGKPRVILYIDDLDRCPPLRVVEVLEAIQLLLNTKLFVVILGLDTRYVTRALEKEYKDILQHEGDPSGLDYIEKIIQIPYRVRPIEKNGLQNYLQSQMKVEFPPQPAAESIAQSASAASSTPSTQTPPVPKASQQNEQIAPSAEKSDQTPEKSIIDMLLEEDKSADVELPAAVIQFKPEDLADLNVCCQKVALTPRSIKRLVNVLKLMKIFWFRTDILSGEGPDYDRPRTVKQAAIALLALSSSYPEVMREAFVSLEALYRYGQEETDLFSALNAVKLPPGTNREIVWQLQKFKRDVSALRGKASDVPESFGQISLMDFKLSTFNLVRSFSFVGDPLYWSDEEEDKSVMNGQRPPRRVTKVNRN